MSTPADSLAVPAGKPERDALRRQARDYCASLDLVPPLSIEELEAHAGRILERAAVPPVYQGFVTVLVGNELWRNAVASTPTARRILLLPQCLKSSRACRAESDALGLLCEECGRCAIGTIQREAEKLGYVVLVAEGTTAVAALLARGDAEAVVGVSCLEALERSFRPLTIHAVPGLAIPLLRNGCRDTAVDVEWVLEVLRLRAPERPEARADIHALRREVAAWFEPASLRALLCLSGSATETLAAEWMARAGKRWRPLLAVGVFRALGGAAGAPPETIRRLAVAVECFHKASLVHDDIEDGDGARYGEQTLHRQHGVAVALNAGDLLIGEGYRLIAEAEAAPGQIREMTAVAAAGHRTLCLGQGEELLLRRATRPASVAAVLEIFRQKTAPAFDVALQLGAILAGADPGVRAVLAEFSAAMGVAYQIADDLADGSGDSGPAAGGPAPASVLAALAAEASAAKLPDAGARAAAEEQARNLLRQYEDEALRALQPLRQPVLKRFLHRVAAMILHHPPP